MTQFKVRIKATLLSALLASLSLSGCANKINQHDKDIMIKELKRIERDEDFVFNSAKVLSKHADDSEVIRTDYGVTFSFSPTDQKSLFNLKMAISDGMGCNNSLDPLQYHYLFLSGFEGMKGKNPELKDIRIGDFPPEIPNSEGRRLFLDGNRYWDGNGYLCAEYDDYDSVPKGRALNAKYYAKLYGESSSGKKYLVIFDGNYVNEHWLQPHIDTYNSITDAETASMREKARKEQKAREAERQAIIEKQRTMAQKKRSYVANIPTGTRICFDGAVSYPTCLNPNYGESCMRNDTTGTMYGYVTNHLGNGNIEMRIQGLANVPEQANKIYGRWGQGPKSDITVDGIPVIQGALTSVDWSKVYECDF